LGSHSRKSSTSKEAKLPKKVKSSSPTENPKLNTLYSLNKVRPKNIKSHEGSKNNNNKSNSSSKISFWVLPDLTPGFEKLSIGINLCDNSNSLIISIHLFNNKNIIHLPNLKLDELESLIS
jgi:hypothetical protein